MNGGGWMLWTLGRKFKSSRAANRGVVTTRDVTSLSSCPVCTAQQQQSNTQNTHETSARGGKAPTLSTQLQSHVSQSLPWPIRGALSLPLCPGHPLVIWDKQNGQPFSRLRACLCVKTCVNASVTVTEKHWRQTTVCVCVCVSERPEEWSAFDQSKPRRHGRLDNMRRRHGNNVAMMNF